MRDIPTVPSAPPTVRELIAWAADQSARLRREVPYQIHSRSGDMDGWGQLRSGEAKRGLPFSKSFLRYMDDGLDHRHAVVRALWRMRREAAPGNGRRMFRVCLALLQGDTPLEIQRRMGLSEFAFATSALHGLSTLRIKAAAEERTELRRAS